MLAKLQRSTQPVFSPAYNHNHNFVFSGGYHEELRDSPGTSLEFISTLGIGAFRNGNLVDQPIHDAGSYRQGQCST